MRYCGPVEFVIHTAEEWRAMPDEVFEANIYSFIESLRAYHGRNLEYRKTAQRFTPVSCEV